MLTIQASVVDLREGLPAFGSSDGSSGNVGAYLEGVCSGIVAMTLDEYCLQSFCPPKYLDFRTVPMYKGSAGLWSLWVRSRNLGNQGTSSGEVRSRALGLELRA